MTDKTSPWVELLAEAQRIVEGKPTWGKFIEGTPLANDIAVWMAEFAARKTTELNEQVRVAAYHAAAVDVETFNLKKRLEDKFFPGKGLPNVL